MGNRLVAHFILHLFLFGNSVLVFSGEVKNEICYGLYELFLVLEHFEHIDGLILFLPLTPHDVEEEQESRNREENYYHSHDQLQLPDIVCAPIQLFGKRLQYFVCGSGKV